ncbi:copper resistance CopC family protein [Paraliobacillus sediminis]|uniref:copper resistance CopC family protein n=1 Tax=Paraliobacillus sediminis TaxID=1885916 RepID=UPI000E3E273C|nr:copper resistance CopC family protein [Paraliobacillus sediminis]
MKHYISLLILVLLLFPVQASAHTHLDSSEPATGEVVSSDNPVITLTFDSPIQEINTISVTDKNDVVTTIEEINHSPENIIEVTLPANLEEGEIEFFYSIIGEDGHVIENNLVFTYEQVDKESSSVDETQSSEKENAEDTEGEAEESEIVEETEQAPKVEATETASEQDEQNGWLMPVIAVILIAIAAIVFLVNRKKK